MMLAPDAERILVGYLLDVAELVPLVDGRIYTAVPANPTFPLLRVHRWGGVPPYSQTLEWDVASVQVDVWGGPKQTALQAAETARAALSEMHLTDPACRRVIFGPLSVGWDDDYTPPKPRVRFDMDVTVRRVPPADPDPEPSLFVDTFEEMF